VNEVWGVGKQTTKQLHLMGIFTAHDLANQSVVTIQSYFNIVLARTVDQINHRFPKTIAISAAGINNNWQTPVNYLSPRYTTDWDSLPSVK